MKVKTLALAAGASALLATGTASAEFLGIDVVKFTNYMGNTGEGEVLPGNWGRTTGAHPAGGLHAPYAASGLNTYRLYATFSAHSNNVALWGGSANPDRAGQFTAKSGTFWHTPNQDHAGNPLPPRMVAPGGGDIGSNVMFIADTYATIGQFVNPSTSWTDEGLWRSQTNNMGDGLSKFSYTDAGPFLTGDNIPTHGAPSLQNQGLVEDGLYRVLIAQISIADGDPKLGIEGTIGVLGTIRTDTGTTESFDGESVMFSSGQQVPGPGALALLGLAGLVGVRRRR